MFQLFLSVLVQNLEFEQSDSQRANISLVIRRCLCFENKKLIASRFLQENLVQISSANPLTPSVLSQSFVVAHVVQAKI